MGRWKLKFLVVCIIGLRTRALTDAWRANFQLGEVSVHAVGAATGAAAADIEDLAAPQVEVAAIDSASISTGGDQDAEGLLSRKTAGGGVQFQ
jgi:hypothetical protein